MNVKEYVVLLSEFEQIDMTKSHSKVPFFFDSIEMLMLLEPVRQPHLAGRNASCANMTMFVNELVEDRMKAVEMELIHTAVFVVVTSQDLVSILSAIINNKHNTYSLLNLLSMRHNNNINEMVNY